MSNCRFECELPVLVGDNCVVDCPFDNVSNVDGLLFFLGLLNLDAAPFTDALLKSVFPAFKFELIVF